MNASLRQSAVAGFVSGVLLVALLPGRALFVDHAKAPSAASAGGVRYACAMMDFIGNAPGDCPVCGMKLQPVTAGELQREQQRRMDLERVTVAEGPARVVVRAYGAAEYDHRYTRVVTPRVAGRIVHRHESTFGCCTIVAEGAPIVDLYSPELIAAQGELLAARAMGDTNLIANVRLRFERWNLADVAAHVLETGETLETVTIRSTISGQMLLEDMAAVDKDLEVGREVMPDTQLLRLVDPDKLALVLQVPESQARFLREGQQAQVSGDDTGPLPDVDARVGRLATEINPQTRTREVRIWLEGARDILQPGALVSARLHGALGPDLKPADPDDEASWGRFPLVPKEAVLSTGVRHVAWRVAGRGANGALKFEIAPLALGPRIEDENGNDLFVVRAGLAPGDEVAARGAFLIDSQAQLAGTPSLLNPQGAVAPTAGHEH